MVIAAIDSNRWTSPSAFIGPESVVLVRSLLQAVLTIAVLGACVWSMRPYLVALDIDRVREAIVAVPTNRLAFAAAATVGSFGALAVLEYLLFAAVAAPVPWRRVLPTAFISDTISASVGLVLVSGGLIRLRLYERWSVSATDVVPVTLAIAPFVITSGLLGAGLAIAGFEEARRVLGFRTEALTAFAIVLLPAVALLVPAGGHMWRWKQIQVKVPSRSQRVMLIAAGLGDWLCTGAAAFALSGRPLTAWPLFQLQFIFGWLFGTASGVPAGVGVIDATTFAAFGAAADISSLAAGLLLFRLIYLVAPTLAAVALWAAIEWLQTRKQR